MRLLSEEQVKVHRASSKQEMTVCVITPSRKCGKIKRMQKPLTSFSHLPLRAEVIELLRSELPGKNLYDLADEFGVTIFKEGALNKGWVGQTIEKVASLTGGNAKGKDGFDFELKSSSLVKREDRWFPKETIKITQLNPKEILEEEFEKSILWSKLSRLIFVGVHHESENKCSTVAINAIDITDQKLTEEIQSFWEDVRDTICAGEMRSLHNLGSSQTFVQLRPLGTGKEWTLCPITNEKFPARAFYATKRLISRIMAQQSVPQSKTRFTEKSQ